MSVWQNYFCHLILLFKLLLLLFMGSTALFDTIHESYCTISANFYLYLQYFQQKIFYFSKISEFQTDPKVNLECPSLLSLKKRSHLSSIYVQPTCPLPSLLSRFNPHCTCCPWPALGLGHLGYRLGPLIRGRPQILG